MLTEVRTEEASEQVPRAMLTSLLKLKEQEQEPKNHMLVFGNQRFAR